MTGTDLILASRSPRRLELLALLGLPFHPVGVDVDETVSPSETPAEAAARLALSKARGGAAFYPHALTIGCDTVVALEAGLSPIVLGKPTDAEQARTMLTLLRGRTHTVYTAVALTKGGQEHIEVARTEVTMRDYTQDEVDAYIASGDPMDKAGAYAIQHPAFRPVASWEGCYSNIVGLPLCHLARSLRAWSVEPATDVALACQAYTQKPCRIFQAILSVEVTVT